MPTAWIIENNGTCRSVQVDGDPLPDIYRAPAPRSWSMKTFDDGMRLFYRVKGIRDLVYVEDKELASALVAPDRNSHGNEATS